MNNIFLITILRIEGFKVLVMMSHLIRKIRWKTETLTKTEICEQILSSLIDLCITLALVCLLVRADLSEPVFLAWQSLLLVLILTFDFITPVIGYCLTDDNRSKKLRAHSLASSYQFFSNRIRRLESQEIRLFGQSDVPLDARCGLSFSV